VEFVVVPAFATLACVIKPDGIRKCDHSLLLLRRRRNYANLFPSASFSVNGSQTDTSSGPDGRETDETVSHCQQETKVAFLSAKETPPQAEYLITVSIPAGCFERSRTIFHAVVNSLRAAL
jgi:hypothetical protein